MATFVAALAGLLTAVTQLRGGSGEAATATTVVVAANETAAERELRGSIPASIAPSCGKPVDPEPGSVAAFNCTYREVVHLQYNLFASAPELRTAFAAVQQRYGVTGKVLRFVDHGSASIVWTDERHDILAFAWRTDRNAEALDDAWLVIDRSR